MELHFVQVPSKEIQESLLLLDPGDKQCTHARVHNG